MTEKTWIACPKCGTAHPARAKFCRECGERFPAGEPGTGRDQAGTTVQATENEAKSEMVERMDAMVWENMKQTPGVSTGPVPDSDRVPGGACPTCGRPFLPGMKFCGVCGARLRVTKGTGPVHPGNP